jgi:hypothetical protein
VWDFEERNNPDRKKGNEALDTNRSTSSATATAT